MEEINNKDLINRLRNLEEMSFNLNVKVDLALTKLNELTLLSDNHNLS